MWLSGNAAETAEEHGKQFLELGAKYENWLIC